MSCYPKENVQTRPMRKSIGRPLVIVSEHGRRTEETRRIVRAQAARASAAQSRATRARNKEERGAATRESTQPPRRNDSLISDSLKSSPPKEPSPHVRSLSTILDTNLPGLASEPLTLTGWLPTIGAVADRDFCPGRVSLPPMIRSNSGINTCHLLAPEGAFGFLQSSFGDRPQYQADWNRFQLPVALPRGFAALQQRLNIGDTMAKLLSRAACIDFFSPGVEQRLDQLLLDLIAPGSETESRTPASHPIQSHLRLACTCLTIFQSQQANGAVFAQNSKYQLGLAAAGSEALLLDHKALSDPIAAEISMWAVFIISVTTGATADVLRQLLQDLLVQLELNYWQDVRKVLLKFIYPVSFLDRQCELLYDSLRPMPMRYDG